MREFEETTAQLGAVEPGAAHDRGHDLIAEQLLEARFASKTPLRHKQTPHQRHVRTVAGEHV